MKHRSKRLLATTCLSAAMMSSAFLPVAANAQDNASQQRKWGAHADVIGSTAQGESAAGVELFVPMLQNEDSIVFVDGSLNGDFDDEVYGSFGVGYRKLITPDLIIGGIVALDYTRSENGEDYGAVTLGAEAIGPVFEARVNVQLPFSDSRKVSESSGPVSDVGTVSLIDNRLVEQLAVGTLRIDEVPLTGVEGELGVNLPIGFESLDDDLRVFAGAYHYSGDGVDDFTGVSGRVEYRVHDVFGEEVPGSDLILSAGATHDEERGTNFAGEIRLRVPLGVPPKASEGDGEYALTALERRMTDHVVRTRKIQTSERRTGSVGSVISEAVVIDATTGRPLDNIRFADGADTDGAGTLADPTSLGDAVADAGVGGVVVAQGGAGAINTTGVTLQNGQSLIGGGTGIPIRLADGTITTFTLGSSIGTIVGVPTASVITLGQNNILRSLDIEGGLAGISGANVGTLIVDRVDISGSAGTGFQIANTGGANTIAISGLTVSGVGGAGVSIDGSGGGTTTVTGFSGVSVSGAGAGGALLSGLVFDADTATAGFQRVQGGPLAISGVTGDGLRLDGVAGDLAFTDLSTANSDGAGLFIRDAGGKAGSFAFGNTAGSIATVNGAAIDVDPVALSLRFATVSSTNAAGQGSGGDDGIFIDTITARDTGTAAVVIGSTTVTGAADDGIFVTNASGGVSFGTVLIDGVGGDGIQLVANNGLVAFGDTVISDPGANGIDISGVNGQVTFGNVDITGLGAGTGLDITDDGPSTRVALAFATLDITGTGAAGSVGIDYSGTTNTFDVTTGDSGTISGVAIGVDLTNAAATGLFRYGDGSATDADGRASTIDAGQPLLVAGVDGSVGTYDFHDVNLVGDISNLAGLTVFYVDADGGNDAGVTDGTAGDPGTLAQAAASGADVIVLVNNQTAGLDVIDAASVVQGAVGTLTLADNQRLASFAAGDTLDLGGGSNVPINVLLTGIDVNIITNPVSGSGSPLLTTTLAGADTVALGDGNRIQGVFIENAVGGSAVAGSGIAGLSVRESLLTSLSLSSATGSAAVENVVMNSLSVSGGSIDVTGTRFRIVQSGATPAVSVSGGHSGAIAFDADSTIQSSGGGLVFDAALGSYDFDGFVGLTGAVDAISIGNGSNGSFTFADAAISGVSGRSLVVSNSAATLTLAGFIDHSAAASAVSISGLSGGSATISASVLATNGDGLQFDNVDGTVAFTGPVALSGGNAGIDILNGSSGSFTFADAAITSPTGTAFSVANSSATVSYTGTIIQNNAASAVSISGMTGGSVTFAGGVSAATATANAIDLSSNAGATVAFNGGIDASTTTGTAFNATGGGTVRIAATAGAETLGTSAGSALNLDGVTADIALDGVTTTGGATAVLVNATGGTLGIAGAVSASNATGDAIVLTGNTAAVGFGSVSVTTAGGAGLRRETSSGAFTVSGATTISGTVGTGINLAGNGATTSFGTTSVTGAGATSIAIFGNTAQTTFGATTIATPAANAIDISGTNAGVAFGAVGITGLAANAVGLDLNGAALTGTVSVASFNLAGAGGTPPAGSIGIDLRGTTGAQTITVGTTGNPAGDTPSIISNVATGVFLNSASNANFTYGDGESATDRASRLLSPTPIDAASAPTLGNYNFLDVDFQGVRPGNGFGNATAYYFSATGTGSGATITDPGNVAGALLSSASALVSLDDGSGNPIDVAGSTTLTLDAAQQLLAFAAPGGTIDLNYTAPATIQISAVDIPVTDTVGNGSAALTNTAALQSVVTLGNGNQLTNIVIDGSAGAGIFGNAVTGLLLDNVSISNTGLAGLSLTGFGGVLTTQNGLDIASTGGFGIDIASVAGASGGFGGLTRIDNVTTPTAGGGVSLSGAGSFFFGGGLDIDTTGGTGFLATGGAIGVGGTSSVSTATGAVIDWSGVTIDAGGTTFASLSATGTVADDAILLANVDGPGAFSGGTVTVAGTSGAGSDGIEVSGGSAASISFGATTIGATGGNGVNLSGANGAVTFASLASTGAAGSGLSIDGATANVTITGNVTATGSGASGVSIANIGAASAVSLSSTTTVSGAGGAGLTVFQTAAGSTVSIASVAIDGSVQQGALLNSNGGTVTISAGTIGATTTNAGGLVVSGGTGAATVDADITNSSGIGISVSRPGGTTTINGTLSQTGSGTGIFLSNSGGTVSFTDTLTLNGTGGGLVAVNTGGTSSFAAVSSTQTGVNSAIDISAASGSASYTFGGQVTADTSAGTGAAVSISGVGTPTVAFNGGVQIVSGSNAGFAASGGATIGVAAAGTRTISTTGGQAINWSGVDIASGGVAFTSLTTGTVANDAILFSNVDGTGTFSGGTVSIAGTSGGTSDGIEISGGSAASFAFGATTIGATGGNGVFLSGANGAVTFASLSSTGAGSAGLLIEDSTSNVTISGATSISNAAGRGIFIDTAGAASTISFAGTTTIAGSGAEGLAIADSVAGSAVSLASVAINGSGLAGVDLAGNAGSVTITAGSIGATTGNAVGVDIDGGTGTMTIGAGISNSTATGVSVVNRTAGTVSFGGTVSHAGTGAGINLASSGGTVSFTDTLTLNGTGGGIVATNTGGATNFAVVSATQTGANEAIDIAAASGSASYVFGGQVTAATSGGTATGVSITGAATQTVAFNGGLAITSGANTGFAASDGATIGVAAAGTRTISTTTGQLLNWSGVDVASGGVSFASLTASGTVAADAVLLSDVDGSGTFSGGATSIGGTSGAGSDGIEISGGSAANFAFGTTTIGATNGNGIALGSGATGNSGTVTFTGTTSITNPGGAGVDIEGTNGAISFASLQIALQSANTTGLDISGAVVGSGANVTATDFDLTATSGAGTIGVDLAGTTGAGTIRLGDTNVAGASATILGAAGNAAGPAVGVQFSSATNTNFIFGDGEATTDIDSAITAVTPVFATDSLPTTGSYNFLDVVLTGDTSALAGPTTYVVDQTGTGSGTFANPGSIGGAELSDADVIVLVDTDPNGTANLIDMAVQTSGGGANTLDLADGQVVISLANGQSIDVSTLGVSAAGAPASFQFSGISASSVISAPLGSIDSTRPILTTNNGPTISLAGSGAVASVVAENTDATSAGHAITGTFTAAGRIILRSVETDTAGGSGLYLRDGGQDISVDIAGFDADGGLRGLDIEGTSLVSGGTGSITVTSLTGLVVDNGATAADGVRFDTVIFDENLATAGIQTVSGGSAVIGTTGDRVQGNGLSFENVAGSLSFADLDIANNGGTGLSVVNSKTNNFLLSVDSGDANNATVNTTGGTAIFLDPLTVDMIFDTVTATGGTTGIVLDTVEGSFRVTGATQITGTSGTGLSIIDNAGTLGVQFDGAVTINNTGVAGGGVAFTGNSATTTASFLGALLVSSQTGAGITASGAGTLTATASGSSVTTTGNATSVSIGAGAGTVSLGGSISKIGPNGAAVDVTGRTGGAVTLSGAINRSGGAVTGITASSNSGGSITFSGANSVLNMGTGGAVSLSNNAGAAIAFTGGGLDIDTTSGTGFSATGGGTITVGGAGNSITTTTGTALLLDGVAVGPSGVVAFDNVSVNGAATGVALTSVTTSAGGVIALGTVNLQGITSRGIDVTTALGATVSVTDLDIGLAGGSAIGLDLNGAALSASFAANDFDLTSSSVGTTIGVDLRGTTTTGGPIIALGNTAPASITGVDTGVFLNSASSAVFTFGDGSNTVTSSTITANFGIDAASAPAAGSYNFADVAFPGSPGRGFGVGRILYVDSDGATGGGDGSGNSAANAATLAGAETASAGGDGDIFVLIDNGNTINAGTNPLNLAVNQQVRGFGNGAINIAITPVANITLSSNAITIADPTGGAAADLTAAAGATNVITLGASGNRIDGFTLTGTGGAVRGIAGLGGASNTVIDHMTISGFTTAGVEITPSTNTTIQNTTFSTNAADAILNAAGTTISNVTSTGATSTAFQINNATGTTTLSNITITNAAGGISFGGASGPAGTVTATNVDIGGSNAVSVAGGNAAITFDAASSITGTGGTAVAISNRSGGSFSHAGAVAVNGGTASFLSVSGATGVNTVSFTGAVDVGQTTRALSGVSINNNATASTATFANIDLTTSGTAFTASNGGTATVTTGTIDSTGAAASLSGIAANLTFTSTTSTSSGTSNISLLNTTGTAAFGSGALSGASGLVAFSVDGGTVSTTYAGSITYAGTGQLIAATSGHTGTLAFSGALSASTGTGIAFNNADGTYNFTGTTVLNGGDAGIDIVNGSGGTITFGSGTTITSPSGTGINVVGGTASLTYSGSLTQANNAAAVSVNGHSGGTLTFNTGTISATNGNGLQFDNADGTYNFNGTTTLNGGDAGIDILNGSTGTLAFGTGTTITHNAAGAAFALSASNANVTYSGAITDNNGFAVDIDGHDGGTVTFQTGAISASTANANGLRVQNSNGGSVNFNGQTTLSTSANAAVTLAGNTGGAVGFNATGNGLDITTTSGAGFSATGGGTVTVQGTSNTISSTTGTALNIANTTIGGTGVTFQSISSDGAANGIVLNTTGSSGGLTVTGTGTAGSGGTIQNTTGAGILLTSTRDVSLSRMIIQNTVRSGIDGTGVVNFALTNSTITNSGITAGNSVVGQANDSNIAFNDQAGGTENNLSGVVNISGNTLSRGYYHGVSIFNYAGTISDLTIANNSYASGTTAAVAQGNGIQIVAFGSASAAANITRATIDTNTITNIPQGVGISVQGGNSTSGGPGGSLGTPGNATNVIAITNNTIDGVSGTVGSEGIVASITGANAGSRGQANFDIAGNTIIDRFGQGISASTFGNATSTMKIRNNTIDTNNAGASIGSNGIGAGTGIVSSTAETPLMTMLVDNNTITDYDGAGIRIVALDAAGTINATITNNQIGPSGGAAAGYPNQINFLVGSDSGGGNNTINLDLRANAGIGTNVATNAPGIGFRVATVGGATNTLRIEGLTPSPATQAQVISYVSGQNPGIFAGTLGGAYNPAQRVEFINGNAPATYQATVGNVPEP